MGRDLLNLLKLGVVPEEKGLTEVRMKSAQTMIQHDARPPSYWYSLDLISTGPSSITLPLLKKEKENVSGELTCRSPDELHCTMYYKYTQGPDTTYEKRFFQRKTDKVKVKTLILE